MSIRINTHFVADFHHYQKHLSTCLAACAPVLGGVCLDPRVFKGEGTPPFDLGPIWRGYTVTGFFLNQNPTNQLGFVNKNGAASRNPQPL
jgi:hypothetical protein